MPFYEAHGRGSSLARCSSVGLRRLRLRARQSAMHGRAPFQLVNPLHLISSFRCFKAFPAQFKCHKNSLILSLDFHGFHESLENRASSLLLDCSESKCLQHGRQVHAQIIANGIYDVRQLKNKVLGMYVLCGSLWNAKNVFLSIKETQSLHWNWMIRGFSMMGRFDFALLFYIKMLDSGVLPDKFTFVYVIKACCSLSAVNFGRFVHRLLVSMGFDGDLFVGSSLIKIYAENNCLQDARQVFDKISERDCVLWNVMIDGYARNGDVLGALELFNVMRSSEVRHNSVTFLCVLSMLTSMMELQGGMQIHGLAIRCGFDLEVSVANALLTMYSKCHFLPDARLVFDLIRQKDVVSWNGIIAGYLHNGCISGALGVFSEMQLAGAKPDSVTFASLLPSFAEAAGLRQGKEVHAYILRNSLSFDAFVKSALMDIYFKCSNVELARKVFCVTGAIDVVIFSTMISGCVLNGLNHDALVMFRILLQSNMRPNSVTLASTLPACASLAALKVGKELHGYILKSAHSNICFVGSALVDMYAKCGRLDLGLNVFKKLSGRDTVAWNTVITSCSQNGQPEEAIKYFRHMGMEGALYDCVAISAALSACAAIPALHYGKQIHAFIIRGALRTDVFAESALIDMYAKCGNLVFARGVFELMHEKNEVSWNSMISAYGTHGHVDSAISLFHKMLETGIHPDHITFLSIISACSHAGLVDEGFHFFNCMSKDYGIMARMEHYACMVDLFGRAGDLEKALSIIRSMPFEPDSGIWGALLGASRVHGNVEIADVASKKLFHMDPSNSGYYVLLANTHAEAGGWEDVLKVRSLMKERGVQKLPGCSWIEIGRSSRMFIAADTSHPESAQIYLLLRCLLLELREAGYVPQTRFDAVIARSVATL
ncbi:pentatricopeptide repeat-containing protein At4g21300 isoform X2 [Nymphaea colorata]|uniref:pentatricopeptide repeat-containing protein At4g21300 isoform X2 n=1 Tax=Nymphaea colorata TaxID=210225 RepID=UPI00214F1C24|nr:pentatricopeptide repeat-containing protein At4g21300 isoform X2 [Nymphaea colorata]